MAIMTIILIISPNGILTSYNLLMYLCIASVTLLQSDVKQLLANIMESVDREDITVACNICQICDKSFS